jgi:hypothetical protein
MQGKRKEQTKKRKCSAPAAYAAYAADPNHAAARVLKVEPLLSPCLIDYKNVDTTDALNHQQRTC